MTDSLRGHATAGVRGAYYRGFCASRERDLEVLDAARAPDAEVVEAARDREWVILVKVPSLRLVRALRRSTRAILVFDFSDALWMTVHRRAGWHDLERILATVDVVLCENDFLRPFAARYNPHVGLAPTSVPLEAFDAARRQAPPRDPRRVVIGWVGSRTTVSALRAVRAPLAALLARHPEIELRAFGAPAEQVSRALGNLPCAVVPEYDEARMIREMLALDIGIYPPPSTDEDYAARGPLKALLYMTAGLPVVCARGGDCSILIRDGISGMLASGPGEWESKLEILIESSERRARMGRAALDVARDSQRPDRLYRDADDRVLSARDRARAGRPSSSGWVEAGRSLRSGFFRLRTWGHRAMRLAGRAIGAGAA